MALLIALAAAGLLAGVMLLLLGWRGASTDDCLSCRGCGFDLSGLGPGAPCPECGADTAKGRGVRIGRRRKRPILLALGLVLVVGAGGGIGAAAWGKLTKFNWNTVKPSPLLLFEARGSLPDERVTKELSRRLLLRELSDSVLRSLIARAFEVQTSPSVPWNTLWGEIIENGRSQGSVTDELWHLYARQAGGTIKLSDGARLERRRGRLYYAPGFHVGEGRGGMSPTIGRHFHIDHLTFAGQNVPIPADWFPNLPRRGGFQLGVMGGFSNGIMPVPDAVGVVSVTIEMTETIEDELAPPEQRVLAQWVRRFETRVDLTGVVEDNTYPPPGPDGWDRSAPDPQELVPLQTRPAPASTTAPLTPK